MPPRVRIRSAHQDGTRCTHRIGPAGEPLDPDCTGRHHYTAQCSHCPGTAQDPDLPSMQARASAHLRTHPVGGARAVTDLHLPVPAPARDGR